MAVVWDEVGSRQFETGVDRGVLFLPNGLPVPWNGLTSITENSDRERTSIYYDGMKINDIVTSGSYSATMKAFTYPDEFVEIEGLEKLRDGLFVGDQPPKVFALSYRTKIGDDIQGQDAGYKLHIIYNVTAIAKDKEYPTMSESPSLVEFEWDITAAPEDCDLAFKPTAHIILDSRSVDPNLLLMVETDLYSGDPIISLCDMLVLLSDWALLQIIDNGDGTWTAVEDSTVEGNYISFPDSESFVIDNVDAVYLDANTYQVSST